MVSSALMTSSKERLYQDYTKAFAKITFKKKFNHTRFRGIPKDLKLLFEIKQTEKEILEKSKFTT